VNFLFIAHFWPKSPTKIQVTMFSYYAQKRVN